MNFYQKWMTQTIGECKSLKDLYSTMRHLGTCLTELQIIATHRRTVKDKQSMKEIVLTDHELEMIDSMQNKRFPASADDPYQVYDLVYYKMPFP